MPQPGAGAWTQTTDVHFLTSLEAGSQRSGCRQGQFLLRPLSWACRWPLSSCVLTWSPLCACVLISSYEDTSQTGAGPTLMTSSPLNHLFTYNLQTQSHPKERDSAVLDQAATILQPCCPPSTAACCFANRLLGASHPCFQATTAKASGYN